MAAGREKANVWYGRGNSGSSWPPAFPRSLKAMFKPETVSRNGEARRGGQLYMELILFSVLSWQLQGIMS